MTRKNYAIIPVLAAIVMIPQCLFWWLAPMTAVAHLAVYIGGTILTIGIPVAYLMTYWNSNLRKASGLSVVCCVLEIAVVALSALLLGINVSVRSISRVRFNHHYAGLPDCNDSINQCYTETAEARCLFCGYSCGSEWSIQA